MWQIRSVNRASDGHQDRRRGTGGFLYPDPARMTAAVRLRPAASRRSDGAAFPARTTASRSAGISPLGQGDTFNPDRPILAGQSDAFNPDGTTLLGQTGAFNPDSITLAGQTRASNPDGITLLNRSETIGHTAFALIAENQHVSQNRLQNVKKRPENRSQLLTPDFQLPTPL
jgi:hypothetical protein